MICEACGKVNEIFMEMTIYVCFKGKSLRTVKTKKICPDCCIKAANQSKYIKR